MKDGRVHYGNYERKEVENEEGRKKVRNLRE